MLSAARLKRPGSTRLSTKGARSAIWPPGVARRRGDGGEVARQHRARRHEADRVAGIGADHRSLIGAEEEQPVFGDRPSERAAELVAAERVGRDRKKRRGVEPVMAQELERAAVELIGSGFRDRVDGAARFHAVRRREAARFDFNLLQRVGKRQRKVGPVVRVVVHRAVQREGQAERLPARHRDPRAARHALIARHPDLNGPPTEGDQVGDLSSVQWQLEDALVLDDLADAGIARLHHRGVRLDRHAFFELSHFQDDVDDRARIDLEHDPGLHEGSKAGQGNLQAIRSEREVRQNIRARAIGHAAARRAGLRLRRGDRHTRQHAA